MNDMLPASLDPATIASGRGLFFKGRLERSYLDEVAQRFDFIKVSWVTYDLNIALISKDCWELRGHIQAEIIQSCVATSDPVKELIDGQIKERFVSDFSFNEEIDVQDSSVEPLVDGAIALTEAVMQFVGVEANPYPRRDGAPEIHEFGPRIEKQNPFSKLSQLKKE
ncbi:MAG: hypothetical protein ACON49_00780 [Candidatus Puniceispirillaceae bacterium]